MGYLLAKFPAQKKPHSKKNDKWREDCINGAESIAMYLNKSIRKSKRNKRINFNLYSNIIDQQDIEQICNPLKLQGLSTPIKMQNYPLCNPKIDLLIGEESRRKFDWKVRVINEDAISQKEKNIQEEWKKFIIQQLESESSSQEELQRKIADFQAYMNYSYQDIREARATWILKHLWEKNRLEVLFNKGFKNALLSSEEIYQWDIIGGEPVCKLINPLKVYTVRSGESPYIEDADIILIEEYYSIGKLIDEYNEYLSDAEIDTLENYFGVGGNATSKAFDPKVGPQHLALKVEESIDIALLENDINQFSPAFDPDGNIRVLRVYWKSMRKMFKRKFFDRFGIEQEDLVDENYVANEAMGETLETIWINEWWEGHKIGGGAGYSKTAIYCKIQPRPIQFRQMENPSKCYPGIVGTIYNTNDNYGMSLMDRMKPYQYLYNVIWYNTELLIATNWGKIMKIPTHEMPDGWNTDMWLYYAKYMKAVPFDAFKEGKKGAAMGKLAGNMNVQNPVLDMEMGQSLNFYLSTLSYIEQKMGEIAGVTPQRQGAIENRETVGGVERSVTQSSLTTEYWFAEHDFLKKRVLEAGLETAKIAWKNKKNKKTQFVLDDFLSKIVEIDGEDFAEMDYDLKISNAYQDKQMFDNIRRLAETALNAGTIDFSQLMDLWTSDSVSAMRNKFKVSEQAKKDYEQMKLQKQQELQNQALQAAAQEKQLERDHDLTVLDKELQNEITLETLKQQADAFLKSMELSKDNGTADTTNETVIKIQADKEKLAKELAHEKSENARQRAHEKEENELDREVEKKKITASKNKPKS
jgi:hypothetical protein